MAQHRAMIFRPHMRRESHGCSSVNGIADHQHDNQRYESGRNTSKMAERRAKVDVLGEDVDDAYAIAFAGDGRIALRKARRAHIKKSVMTDKMTSTTLYAVASPVLNSRAMES